MTKKYILVIGLDPNQITISAEIGQSAPSIGAGLTAAIDTLQDLGHEVHTCLLAPAEATDQALLGILSKFPFDCIMIGAGLRVLPEHTLLFERVINAIHQNAPLARICFNTNPNSTVEAVLRWIDQSSAAMSCTTD